MKNEGFVRKKGQPHRIYFVRWYWASLSHLPDNQTPYSSLKLAKIVAKMRAEDHNFNGDNFGDSREGIEEFVHIKIYPTGHIKASYFKANGCMLVAAQGNPGPTITIEMIDDEKLIAGWWNEEEQEFYNY